MLSSSSSGQNSQLQLVYTASLCRLTMRSLQFIQFNKHQPHVLELPIFPSRETSVLVSSTSGYVSSCSSGFSQQTPIASPRIGELAAVCDLHMDLLIFSQAFEHCMCCFCQSSLGCPCGSLVSQPFCRRFQWALSCVNYSGSRQVDRLHPHVALAAGLEA